MDCAQALAGLEAEWQKELKATPSEGEAAKAEEESEGDESATTTNDSVFVPATDLGDLVPAFCYVRECRNLSLSWFLGLLQSRGSTCTERCGEAEGLCVCLAAKFKQLRQFNINERWRNVFSPWKKDQLSPEAIEKMLLEDQEEEGDEDTESDSDYCGETDSEDEESSNAGQEGEEVRRR
jgi:hypothetical protein